MERQELLEKVIDVTSRTAKISKEEIKEDSHFIDDLDLDSLDTVEFVLIAEEELNIEIDDEVSEYLSTVGSFVDYIMENDQQ